MKSKQDEWRERVSEQQSSGKSASEYCRERGLSVNKFAYYRGVLSAKQKAPKFVAVSGVSEVRLLLPTGVTISASVDQLSAVLKVLECAR